MTSDLWQRFQRYLLTYDDLGFSIDVSRMRFADDFFATMQSRVEAAFASMRALEAGAIANPDENRMVGHYWLRAPALAPNDQLRADIEKTNAQIGQFAADVHSGKIGGANGGRFAHVLLIGIGGSALGPQFVADALGTARDPVKLHFFDNTDPDGFDRVFAQLADVLPATLVVVVSKSGGTKETRNGMLEAEAHYKRMGLDFGKHAVAVTGVDSELDRYARAHGWLARFPMFDWIGGRTSVMSAVGLVPAALQGFDIKNFLAGAAAMDAHTRTQDVARNAAMLLALMWYYAGNGRGEKDMVVLPYKDRLMLFSRYLQQLVMESLGKEKDLAGNVVRQGIAVYGNKGSTDQHAYVQQLRDGVLNFFVTFIEVRQDRATLPLRGRGRRDQRRLFAGIPARNAHGAFRERPGIDHAEHSGSERLSRGCVDCALRTRGWILWLAGQRQCVPPAGGGSRQESGNEGAGAAATRDRKAHHRTGTDGR